MGRGSSLSPNHQKKRGRVSAVVFWCDFVHKILIICIKRLKRAKNSEKYIFYIYKWHFLGGVGYIRPPPKIGAGRLSSPPQNQKDLSSIQKLVDNVYVIVLMFF